jgi:sterol desaturase/sphingolipid hydroxylase (fatty acid hydroxylase superfamily)
MNARHARGSGDGSTPERLPIWISAPLVLGTFGLLLWLERRRPLRPRVEPTSLRTGRNVTVAALTAGALQLTERPIISRLTKLVGRRRWGLLKRLRLPAWLEISLAVVLLDYTLYLWHVLLHRAPWLWRIHVVHHVDLDLDTSTSVRFHAAEMIVSVGWRAGQVALIGVSPLALSLWQTLLLLSVMFHHSNIRLPIETERRLNRLIVTPRMHGIHHSIVQEETNSNWSSGLTLWDRIHGTLRLDVPQETITIGVPAYRSPEDVTLDKLIVLPFITQRPTWRFVNGQKPLREPVVKGVGTALSAGSRSGTRLSQSAEQGGR